MSTDLVTYLQPPEGTSTIVLMEFGSHLYGTNSPTSDRDYKGVFMPAVGDILMGKIPKSITVSSKKGNEAKNTAADYEVEWFSLHYFIKLALEGQTVAIDMLHAGIERWLKASPEWVSLHQRRHAFYTRSLHAFVGYARRQAAKYGIKGSRLASAKWVLNAMEGAVLADENVRVETLRNYASLANLEHCHKTEEHFEVCGRKLQWNARISLYLDGMRKFVRQYGERAIQAEASEGVDWKAMSHAVRAAFEVQAMLRDGDFRFPLPQVDLLKKIKSGVMAYNDVAQILEAEMEECERLAAASTLPDKPAVGAWEAWLKNRVADYLLQTMTKALKADELDTLKL